MKKKIWQIGSSLHPLVEKFTVMDEYLVDQKLLAYDIKASMAHAKMLASIKIISKKELVILKKALQEILTLWKKDKFKISQDQEDSHTAIEQYITNKYGEVGKKIHTGRSRNDQVLVMMRLFAKERIEKIILEIKNLIKEFDVLIKKNKNIPMPGYTHMQKAMPTTVDTWLGAYREALSDTLINLGATEKQIDQNPLGSAAGFGISNLKLDRDYTSKELKFKKTQKNPIYCAFSRGYFENIILQSLSQIMIVFSRFASDMMLFTTQEFDFFSLPNNFTTGSSIMPQKRNYDLFEIMRANARVFTSYQLQIQEIISGLGAGYHRDFSCIKKPFVSGVELCEISIDLMVEVIKNFKIKQKNLENAMTPDLYLTEEVYKLVSQGMSFRDAYVEVKEKIYAENKDKTI